MERLSLLLALLTLAPTCAAPSRRKHMRNRVSMHAALDKPEKLGAGSARLPIAAGYRAPGAEPDEGSGDANISTTAILQLSSDLPLAMRAEWRPGTCGTTFVGEGAQCRHSDTQGAAAGVRNLSACLAFCAACPRCRYISYSEGKDCSWYATCDTSRLEHSWLRHRTAQVRHVQRPRRCQAAQLDSRGGWREERLFAGWHCPLWETSHARFNCSGDLPQRAHLVTGCGRPNAAASLLSGSGGGHRTLFFVGDSLSGQHARAVTCRVLYDATHAASQSRHAAPRRSASLRTHLPRWAAAIKLENFMVPACTPECHQVSTAALLDDASLATAPSSSVTVCHVPAGTRDRGCAEGVLPVVERLLSSRVVRWEDAIIMNEGLHHSMQARPPDSLKDDQPLRP